MSKITIIEGNSNDKDNTRAYMVKGEKGYSAYELYVQKGGTLTEEEWLDEFLNAENFYNKSETNNFLNDKVEYNDIIDNLTSTSTDKALSANQGKILKDSLDINIENTNRLINKRIVLIGDSYLRGDHNGIASVNGWGHYVKTTSGIADTDFFSFSEGGSGFYKTGDAGHTFKTLLQNNISSVTDKDSITDVVICGGCNDRGESVANITQAISDMVYYCKQQFLNATIYVGMIGNNASITDETYRRNVITRSLYSYKKCVYYGAKYLTGVEYLMHNYEYYDDTDNTHPTQEGYKIIGKAIFNLVYNGVNIPFYQSTELIGKQSLEWNSDFTPGENSTQMGFTSIINGTSKQVFINSGTCYITAENIHFTDNLLKLTNTLPFNLNYRNFYQNYTPGWSGILFVKFAEEQNARVVPGYYMIRNHCLYFNAFGENNKNISNFFVPSCNNNCDLLYT